MARALDGKLDRIDEALLRGDATAASRQLAALARHALPAADRARVANLARRAGHNLLALSVLARRVRRGERLNPAATPLERAEYACALANVGASREAAALFATLKPGQEPRAEFLQAVALFNRWGYREAVPLLESFVASGRGPRPERISGAIRLAAAYLRGLDRGQAADERLREILRELDPERDGIFVLNARLLRIEAAYLRDRDARAALSQLRALDRAFPDHGNASLEIWKSVFEAVAQPRLRAPRLALDKLRARLSGQRHWSMVRTCDLYTAAFLRDEALFRRVFFGTPFSGFHFRLRQLWGENAPAPGAAYDWTVGEPGRAARGAVLALDLRDGSACAGRAVLKQGQLTARLLGAVASDFYRPLPVAELCEAVYPGDFFDPVHSPLRLHAGVLRARAWLARQGVPLALAMEGGGLRLAATRAASERVTVRVPNPEGDPEPPAPALLVRFVGELQRARPGAPEFTARDAAAALGRSTRSLQYELEKAIACGLVERMGKGPATRYRFAR